MRKTERNHGQGLLEIIIVIAIIAVIAIGIGTLMMVGLRSNTAAKRQSAAQALAQEAQEAIASIAGTDYDAGVLFDSGYLRIYYPKDGVTSPPPLTKGASGPTVCDSTATLAPTFRVVLGANNQWSLDQGSETITRDGDTYRRCLYIENVCRDDTTSKITAIADSGGSTTTCGETAAVDTEDPTTQRIFVRITNPNTKTYESIFYVTRASSGVTAVSQTDWSGTTSDPRCTVTQDQADNPTAGSGTSFNTKFGCLDANLDVLQLAGSIRLRPGQLQVFASSYTGNGSASQAITAPGFQPQVLIVKPDAGEQVFWKSSTIGGTTTAFLTSGTANAASGFINSLDASGFTVAGTAAPGANVNLQVYYYVAIRDPSGSFMKAGSYSGTGAAQSITGVGFRPSAVITKRDGVSAGAWAQSSLAAGNTFLFSVAAGTVTDAITSLDADGFTLGVNASANAASTYHYVAFAFSENSIETGTYGPPGDGADNRSITSPSFMPRFIIVKRLATDLFEGARFGSSGDESGRLDANAWTGDFIQRFEPSGFQVGLTLNAAAATYHFFAVQ